MDEEVSPLERDLSLSVVLPGGLEKAATVHGSQPVMDLLVTLCASYHLNPSDYTVEFLSANKNNISFKPNSAVGLLEAEKIVLKPKETEEKIRTPYVPEATVRLLINYNKSHKAVVRVNPRVPLEMLLPAVCDKCEFQVESTVLLRNSESKEPLDLSRTLNELGLREVFAKDTAVKDCTGHQHPTTAAVTPTKVPSSSSLQELTKKERKKSENKGFLSLFRKQRKKSEPDQAVSAPVSPGFTKQRSVSISTQDITLCTTPPADVPKKRPAPQPPMSASQSIPNNLSTCHIQGPQKSGENTLRSTKRRAPLPPVANHHQEYPEDTAKDCLTEEKECEKPLNLSPSPLPSPPPPPPPPHPHKAPESHQPSIKGKDLSDARSALAKVLTSSLSTGMLVKRLKNSKTNSSSSMSTSENGMEIKSVLNSGLPTENEWEDSLTKKGLTTFKVVPSRRQSDTEPTQDVPEQEKTVIEPDKTSEEVLTTCDQAVTEEGSPDQSEGSSAVPCLNQSTQEEETTSCPLPPDNPSGLNLLEVEGIVETPKQDEEMSSDDLKEDQSDQSHKDMTAEGDLYVGDQEEVAVESHTEINTCDSETCDDKVEGVTHEDEDRFPPPPPPVYFNEDLQEASIVSTVSAPELPRADTNGHVCSSSEPAQKACSASDLVDKAVSAPSGFAQAVAMAVQRSRLHSTGRSVVSESTTSS